MSGLYDTKLNLSELPPLDPSRGRSRKRLKIARWNWRQKCEGIATRTLDIVVGIPTLYLALMLTPVLAIVRRPGNPLFRGEERIGKFGRVFREYRFATGPKILRGLPVGLNLVRGDVSLVGPRALTPSEGEGITPAAFRRMDVRPGLIGLHRLRRQTNIDFEPEFKTDAEYVEKSGLKSDLGLVARYVTTAWAGDEVVAFDPELDILGVKINNLTMPEAIDWIVRAAEGDQPQRLCFVNADCMNLTFRNRTYAQSLLNADQVLADGIGLKVAGKILKKPIIQNVNGTDLFPRLCDRVSGTGHSFFLLGGGEGVAKGVAEWVERNHPEAKIAGIQHGFFKPEELPEVREKIKTSGATILLVAFGAPKQDLWIQEQLEDLGPKVAMGVGGLFDFYSDRIPRAPQWMRELGLEWLFRLIQEPGRMWKRYLVGNAVFLFRVIRYRKSGRRIS